MIVDKSGNSAIIEWGQDELSVVEKKDFFQVMTNFNTTVPSIAFAYPCFRYNQITKAFMSGDEISVERFRSLMDDVDSDGTKWAHTVYSTVFDLREKRIYLYYLRDYDNVIIFDLENELAKGEHVYDLKSYLTLDVLQNNIQTITSFNLFHNYPNPFNPSTTISYQISEKTRVNLTVYNINGQIVKTLDNNVQERGLHCNVWDGTDSLGEKVASGIYLYRLNAGNFSKTQKMTFMR